MGLQSQTTVHLLLHPSHHLLQVLFLQLELRQDLLYLYKEGVGAAVAVTGSLHKPRDFLHLLTPDAGGSASYTIYHSLFQIFQGQPLSSY